jgi:hypothetical protein
MRGDPELALCSALDQGDGTGVGRLVCPPCLFDQMRGEEGNGRVQ